MSSSVAPFDSEEKGQPSPVVTSPSQLRRPSFMARIRLRHVYSAGRPVSPAIRAMLPSHPNWKPPSERTSGPRPVFSRSTSREAAAKVIQASCRGLHCRTKVDIYTVRKRLAQMEADRHGFVGLAVALVVAAAMVAVIFLQSDVGGAHSVEFALQRAVARAHEAHPDVQTASEALQWAITSYEQLYHFEDGLIPHDREARDRAERGTTPGYNPTLQRDCAPVLPGCGAAVTSPVDAEPSMAVEPETTSPSESPPVSPPPPSSPPKRPPSGPAAAEPEAEPEAEVEPEAEAENNTTTAEPGAEAEAEAELSASITDPPAPPPAEPEASELEPEAEAEVEAEAWPEPIISVLQAVGSASLPDACKRFLLHDEARRAAPRNDTCEAVRRQRSARESAYLHGSHNRFVGPLFVVQRRRREVPCSAVGGEASAALFPQCYEADTADAWEETRPFGGAHHFYQFHNRALGGYVLPADLGLFRVMKDTGLCFMQLAAAEDWADRATRDIVVSFATFNGQLSRWGAVDVHFSFALGGGGTTHTRIATARDAHAPYVLGAWHLAVEVLCLLLLLLLEVFPLLRRAARLGLRRGFSSTRALLDLARTSMSLVIYAVWLRSVLLSVYSSVVPPTRSIMDHPEDFTAIVTTTHWVRRMASTARLHTIVGAIVLALHMVQLLGALRFHPHTAVLVNTLLRCATRLQATHSL